MSTLLDWLSLRDFAHFDSALCNKKSRAELQQSILASRHTISTQWADYGEPKAQWLIQRGIRCRAVWFWKELVTDPLLREQFLIHSGHELLSVHLGLGNRITEETNEVIPSSLREIVHGLAVHCPGLKKIKITMNWDKYILSSDDFTALHTFVMSHAALKILTLRGIELVPLSFVVMALTQLSFVSLENCSVANDVSITTLPATRASFKCVNTPIPPELCAHVIDLTANNLQLQNGLSFANFSNISRACVNMNGTKVDTAIAQQICNYWDKLMHLRFNVGVVDEDIVLMLIKQMPTLQVLSTIYTGNAELEVREAPPAGPSSSHLYELSMHCSQTSTLEQVLQLCPQLTRLSLQQPTRSKNAVINYVPVETSLYLLRNTSVRALLLKKYSTLCNENLVVLQHTDLHALSIVEAGINLNDKAILALIPTLSSLNTLDISYCTGLSYKLVLQVPPLCTSLRSYTYYKPINECCGDDSHSCLVLDELLPKFFPHVKEFSIHC